MTEERGNILLSLIFVCCAFSLAAALLSFTFQHLKIIRARNSKIDHTQKITAALSLHLHRTKKTILNTDLNPYPKPAEDFFNSTNFPSQIIDKVKITNIFSPPVSYSHNYYEEISKLAKIKAVLGGFNYCQSAEIRIKILKGEIPLLMFPLIINKDLQISQEEYLKKNQTKIQSFTFVNIDMIHDPTDFLISAMGLKTHLFSWRTIRKKLQLEESNQPLDAGIYLFESNNIDCIFIQGDVESIIFSTNLPFEQIIDLKTASRNLHLSYLPKSDKLQISISDQDSINPLPKMFSEKILINGDVLSVSQKGDFAFQKNSDIILYVSKTIAIDTSLLSEPASHRSNFTIINLHNSLQPGFKPDCRISIESDQTLFIDGSIITGGKLLNTTNSLSIRGNLITKDLKNQGRIIIKSSAPNHNLDQYFKTIDRSILKSIFIDLTGSIYNEQ
jgi:hypothetical protein